MSYPFCKCEILNTRDDLRESIVSKNKRPPVSGGLLLSCFIGWLNSLVNNQTLGEAF